MNNQTKLKKYLITWTAHACEAIEAHSLQEAINLANNQEPPQIMDFCISLSDPDVERHPDCIEE